MIGINICNRLQRELSNVKNSRRMALNVSKAKQWTPKGNGQRYENVVGGKSKWIE